jgi:RNA polymerase sigma-70 factor (ECF subfamily)
MGAHERWRRTFEDEQERLWRSLWSFTGDPDVAREAVAEAFAQGLRRGDSIRDPAAWVWRTAFRVGAGLLSQRHRGPVGDPDFASIESDDVPLEELVALFDALERLGVDDRQVIALGLVGGLDAAAMGQVLDVSAGAARVRLHRARARLRVLLEASEDSDRGAVTDEPTRGGL